MFLTRFLALLMVVFITACQPTVKIEAPDKPIVINLNIKLEEEIIIRLDKDIEKLLSENHDLF